MLSEYKGNFIKYIEDTFTAGVEEATYVFGQDIKKLNIEVSNTIVGILPSSDARCHIVVEGSTTGLSVNQRGSQIDIKREAKRSNTQQAFNNVSVQGNITIGNIHQVIGGHIGGNYFGGNSLPECKITIFVPAKGVKTLWVDATDNSCVASSVRYADAYIDANDNSQVGFASKGAIIDCLAKGKVYCVVSGAELTIRAKDNSLVKAKGSFSTVIVNSSSNATVETEGDCLRAYTVKATAASTVRHTGAISGSLKKTVAPPATFNWVPPKPEESTIPYKEEIEASLLKILEAVGNKEDVPLDKLSPCDTVVATLVELMLPDAKDMDLLLDNILTSVAKVKPIYDLLNIPFFEVGILHKLVPFNGELQTLLSLFDELSKKVKDALK